MGSALAGQDTVFHKASAKSDAIFTLLAGFSIRTEIIGSGYKVNVKLIDTTIVQLAIAVV